MTTPVMHTKPKNKPCRLRECRPTPRMRAPYHNSLLVFLITCILAEQTDFEISHSASFGPP